MKNQLTALNREKTIKSKFFIVPSNNLFFSRTFPKYQVISVSFVHPEFTKGPSTFFLPLL